MTIHYRASLEQNISEQGEAMARGFERANAAARQLDSTLKSMGSTRAGAGGAGAPGLHWSNRDYAESEAGMRRLGVAQANAYAENERRIRSLGVTQANATAENLRREENRIATERRLEEGLAADRRKWAADEMTAEREKNALIDRRMNLQSNALMRLNKEMLAEGRAEGGTRSTARSGSGLGVLSKIWLGKMAFDAFKGAAGGFLGEAIHQSEFKRGQVGEFSGLLGPAQGGQFYNQMQDLADRSSLKMTDLSPVAVQLMHMGMNRQQTMASSVMLNDLVASTHVKPESYTQLAKIYERGVMGNRLGARTWGVANTLTQGAVNSQAATEAVMKSEGVSKSRAEFLLSGKNKDTDSYIRTFIDAFRQMQADRDAQFGGGAGAAMDYFGRQNASTQITTLEDRWGSLFRDIDTSKFAQGLARINDQLKDGSPLLDRAKGAMQGVFDAIVGPWIERWQDPAKIKSDIDGLIDGIVDLGRVAGGASSLLLAAAVGLQKIMDVLTNPLVLGLASGAAFATGSPIVGTALGAAAIASGVGRFQEASGRGDNAVESVWTGVGLPRSFYTHEGEGVAPRHAKSTIGGHPDKYASGAGRAAFQGLGKIPGHADGGITLADHLAQIHKDEIIIPLERSGPVLADAMQHSGGGAGHHVVMHMNPVFVMSGEEGDASTRQRLEESVDELFGSAFERFSAQVTGGL